MADDFGMDALLSTLNEQETLAEKRRQLQIEDAKKADATLKAIAETTRKSTGITQDLMTSLGPIMDTLKDVEAGREEQERLKTSGKPGDFFEYVGNQVLDPGKYTKAGRQSKIAEATTMLGVKTQVANLQQAALGDVAKMLEMDYKAGGGDLAMASLIEQQGNERLAAEVLRVESQAKLLQTNRMLAEQKLSMMSSDEVKSAAAKAGGKPIDIGGVMISAGDLESRMVLLTERELLAEQRLLAQETKKFDLDRKLAKKELETMNLEELRQIMTTGSPRYELSEVESIYKIKNQARADDSARQMQLFQYEDFGASTLVPVIQELDRIAPSIPKGGQLDASFKGYKSLVTAVTQQLRTKSESGEALTVEDIAAGSEALKIARASFDVAIEKEAKLKSGNDENLKNIYVELYRGNPVPQASVELAVMERLEKGRPLTDVLPEEPSKLIREKYNARYQELLAANQTNWTVDKGMLKKQAMQEAMQEGIATVITDRTQNLFVEQFADPAHPLSGVMHPTQMLGAVAEADARGMQSFMQTYGLTSEEMDLLLQGKPVPGKISTTDAGMNLAIIQNQEFLMSLDAKQAGLAKKYVEWWNTNGGSFVNATQEKRVANSRATGLQDSAMETYAATMEGEQMAAYSQGLNAAYDSYEGTKYKQYEDMLTFDLRPEHRQAVLLQLDESLSDAERSTLMKGFILPLVTAAKQQNLDFDATNIEIEKAIDANFTENPQVAKILKKVAANRPGLVQKMETMTEARNMFKSMEPGGPKMGFQPSAWARRSVARYGWYQEIMKGK